jgi:hypothetical protein
MKEKYKNELKIIDTQEKAYLLGFMYGDGTISTYTEINGRIRHLSRISICIDDKDMLLQLLSIFPYFNVGYFDFSKYNLNSKKQISLSKSSKELYNDLLSNGLFPRKSYENACKLKLPDINQLLIPHFIRGFFDADGSVYIPTRRRNLLTMEFSSVSMELLESLNIYLKSKNINCWKINTKHPSKGRQTCHALVFNKTAEIQKLIDLMYKDSIIFLKRKKEKCILYKPVDKVGDRNMTCKFCGSNRVQKNGTRGDSTRFICDDCMKGFSIKTVTFLNK